MSNIFGCTIDSVADCRALLSWVKGEGSYSSEAVNTCWLLAHCDDGVVWGKRGTNQRQWELSSTPFPDVSPLLSEENLQQLRVFGPQQEVLIWRAEDGFTGRVLADTEEVFQEDNPLRPKDESHILVGDRRLAEPVGEFSLVGDGRGVRHAIPLKCEEKEFEKGEGTLWPLRLTVKHYMSQDEETGVVRIAASRLVEVKKEKN